MKSRLNITIEEGLIEQAKQYASKHKTSLSQLVEQYFKSLKSSETSSNIIEMVEKLPKPNLNTDRDLKKEFYEDQKDKYGF